MSEFTAISALRNEDIVGGTPFPDLGSAELGAEKPRPWHLLLGALLLAMTCDESLPKLH